VGTNDPLHGLLDDAGDRFAVMVTTSELHEASPVLRDVAAALAALTGPGGDPGPRISAVAPLPHGALLRVDGLSARIDTRRRATEAVRGALLTHDLADAAVEVRAVDGLADLDACPRAVVLRLLPPPAGAAGRLDPEWIDVACDWVFGDLREDSTVRVRVLGVELEVRAAEAAGVVHGCAAAQVWCDVVTGDLATRVRTASISFGAAPHVAVGAGGPRCDDDGLLARFDLLREVVGEVGPGLGYACIDFEPTFADLGAGFANTEWALDGGAAPNTVAGRLCDRFVPEVFPYQVLGPGHLERLRAVDPGTSWGTHVGPDHRAVEVGRPEDWLPTSDVRAEARADGWKSLDPLLLRTEHLADELSRSAQEGAPPPREADHGEGSAGHGLPELDAIVVDAQRHPRRGTHLTVLELAAWLAGEPQSDAPSSVSPVLARFVRQLGAGLDLERRQRLKPLAARLVGTAGDDAAEDRRALRLTDWMVRCHAPPWLRSAGLTESADRLDGLVSIEDDADLVRAVEVLGNAIVTAGRRLEITTAIAGTRADVVDDIAWDAWELAAERSAWTAASEAVLHDVPPDLAFAADQRVVECSRDPRIRAELEASTGGLGDAIWSAALHEIAVDAWRAAWLATEDFVHQETRFSIRTAMRRSLEDGLGPDEDGLVVEAMLEDIDRLVADELVEAVLRDDGDADHWELALAAVGSDGPGAAWRAALDQTRRILGPTLFDDAAAVARGELTRWLERAPALVGRVVSAAVAREASGVAGRAVAARAAAESMARGGSQEDAEDAAAAALDAIVAGLADDALRLAEELAAFAPDSGMRV